MIIGRSEAEDAQLSTLQILREVGVTDEVSNCEVFALQQQ